MTSTSTCLTCFSSLFPSPRDLHLTCSCGLSPLFTKAHSSSPHTLLLSLKPLLLHSPFPGTTGAPPHASLLTSWHPACMWFIVPQVWWLFSRTQIFFMPLQWQSCWNCSSFHHLSPVPFMEPVPSVPVPGSFQYLLPLRLLLLDQAPLVYTAKYS